MHLFTAASIAPFVLILVAAGVGGAWGWLALGYITVFVFVIDRVAPADLRNARADAEFPGAGPLLVALGGLHFGLLGVALWAVAGSGPLAPVDRALVALATALVFGQISHPVAHELVHRPARAMRFLGKLIYGSILFGHHASAHLLVHHVHVGTRDDPNSARWGEGFWRFAARAWPGGMIAGYRAETRRMRAARRSWLTHPYALYLGFGAGLIALSLALFGLPGVLTLLFLSLYAQIQILLSDYVQHYGLRREAGADGRVEPVSPRHSWNAPQLWSSAMTLNASRHSDHHVTPQRPYPALQMRLEEMPMLPHALPVMAVLALVPPLWRRVMDPRCAAWHRRNPTD